MKTFSYWVIGLNDSDIWKKKNQFSGSWSHISLVRGVVVNSIVRSLLSMWHFPPSKINIFLTNSEITYLVRNLSLSTRCSGLSFSIVFPFILLDILLEDTASNFFGNFNTCHDGWWVSFSWAQRISPDSCVTKLVKGARLVLKEIHF